MAFVLIYIRGVVGVMLGENSVSFEGAGSKAGQLRVLTNSCPNIMVVPLSEAMGLARYSEWGERIIDGTDGFGDYESGWTMPIHQLLVENKVPIVLPRSF